MPPSNRYTVAKPEAKPRAAFRSFTDITTRWMDNDAYGHINNVIYYSFFDTAVNQFLISRGCIDIKNGFIVGFVVETGCQYFMPTAFPDKVTAGLRVTHLGRSSVRYEIGIFRNEDDTASAQGHFVHVYVDRHNSRPVVALPALIREALQPLLVADSGG